MQYATGPEMAKTLSGIGPSLDARYASQANQSTKQPPLQERAVELINHLLRLGANQSLIRERLFSEGEQKSGADTPPPCGLEQLLALACQNAANLVGESEGILRRL